MAVYALSIHADYRCRHSGACCTSEWDIPVDLPLYRTLAGAVATGDLQPAANPAGGTPVLMTGPDLPHGAAAMVARARSGECVFYHRASGLCVIHRDAGAALLPSACRHFPRLTVRDWRGTSISLTHYCPTAAAMLFRDDVPIEIVEGPAAFPPADYEGLVVKPDDWPPLLHPHVLMDAPGYAAWERHMVARCADGALSPESVIATLDRDARILRRFAPGDGWLADAVARLPEAGVAVPPPPTLARSLERFSEVMSAAPVDVRPAPDEERLPEVYVDAVASSWSEWHWPLKRYLAARAFASWVAYQGRGVLTIVRGLEAALAVVRVEAARECHRTGRALDADLLREAFQQADCVLNHLAVGEDLAGMWSRVEGAEA